MKKTLTTGALAALLALTPLAPAGAAAAPFDVSDLRAGNVKIRSTACVDLDISATTNATPKTYDVKAVIGFSSGTATLPTMVLYRGSSATRMDGEHQLCPAAGDRPGTYTMRIVQASSTTAKFGDSTTGVLRARQDSRVSFSSSSRSGSTRRLTAKASYYDAVRSFGWKNLGSGTTLTLQRRASTGAAWAKVGTAKVNGSGAATFSTKASRSYQYRVLTPGSSTTWNATSATITR